MAAESILTYRKPGFPKTSNSEKSYRTTVEYVGPLTTLSAAEPAANTAWGDYDGFVSSSDLSPIEGTEQAELTVVTEYQYEAGSSGAGAGTAAEISYEVEWVAFGRSLYEHPEFSIDEAGTYKLTTEDIAAIEKWQNEDDVAQKKIYKYKEKESDSAYVELSTNAKMFARGIEIGQEEWEDYAPVVRKTTTYLSGIPSSSTAGLKGSAPTFDCTPTGYEWRKSADRAVRAGGQTRWDRVEEWTGAKKVLTDKTSIYWTAPA